MAGRIAMEKLEYNSSVVQELFHNPTTNRRHLEIAHRALHEVIDRELTPRQREMLLMRYYECKRASQIARELGVHPSTVTRTLRRAEEHIRKSMRFYFDYRSAVLEEDD